MTAIVAVALGLLAVAVVLAPDRIWARLVRLPAGAGPAIAVAGWALALAGALREAPLLVAAGAAACMAGAIATRAAGDLALRLVAGAWSRRRAGTQPTAGHPPDAAAPVAAPEGARPDGVRPDGVRPDGVRPGAVRPLRAARDESADRSAPPAHATHPIEPAAVAHLLAEARRVVVIPGHGLAVAQAQHTLARISHLVQQRGIEVLFAVHPDAGRVPGHLARLLAEAGVPDSLVRRPEMVGDDLARADLALVVGARAIVAPTEPRGASDRAPGVEAGRARRVVVVDRDPGRDWSFVAAAGRAAEPPPEVAVLVGDAQEELTRVLAHLVASESLSVRS
ncbi:MAG: NAD(P)(+) transhydrogenase (Re/Si-specific) subunit beta [Kineosporiaceae bacterium]|nr:NAD(P)(+) transhydrogenase (Re/Si-specific) subunit beta [Kineosporiaceae bacterium]